MNASLRAGSITPIACGHALGGVSYSRALKPAFRTWRTCPLPAYGSSCLSLNSLMSSAARRYPLETGLYCTEIVLDFRVEQGGSGLSGFLSSASGLFC